MRSCGRDGDRVRVGDHAGRFRKARAGCCIEMARVISGSASKSFFAVPGRASELRLNIAIDEEVAAQLLHEAQAWAGERDVELDLEGRRGEDRVQRTLL